MATGKQTATEKALERFGLKQDPTSLPNVVVAERELPSGTIRQVTISRESALGAIVSTVECFDLDDVKRMIGLPNRLAGRKRRRKPRRLSNKRLYKQYTPDELARAYEEGLLTRDQQEFIEAAGRTYVFGDSRQVQDFKAILETVYTRGAGRFDLTAACFGTIRIRNGWSLVITSSIQLFCANQLLLEPEARVVRTDNAHVAFNVNRIRVVEPELPVGAEF